jgi:uncharacterized membrane protein YeaQ/YmgE (transglycosylase-associated protein family)
MDLVQLLTTIVTGAVGGNAAGMAMKDKSLGTVGNTIAGVLGGGVASQLLPLLSSNLDLSSLLGNALAGNVAGSGIGGAVAMAAVALVKQYLNKSATTTA